METVGTILIALFGAAVVALYVYAWVSALLQIARSALSDTAKGAWVLVIVLAPFLGLLVWTFLRPDRSALPPVGRPAAR